MRKYAVVLTEEQLHKLGSLLDRETIGDELADTLFVETQMARPISDELAIALFVETRAK